jgi:hypothetical protein
MKDKIKILIESMEENLSIINYNRDIATKLGFNIEYNIQTELYKTIRSIVRELKDILREEV